MTNQVKLGAVLVGVVLLGVLIARLIGGGEGSAVAAPTPGRGEHPFALEAPALAAETEGARAAEPETAERVTAGALPEPEPESESPGDPFGSLSLSVAWHDGEPAAGVYVRVHPWDAPDTAFQAFDLLTDGDGRARAERVPAGRVGLYPLRGGGQRVEIEPGEETEAELTLPRGLDVAGTVLDSGGQAVEGAGVWLSVQGNTDHGRIVATSAADGTFSLRSVASGQRLNARKSGHRPSLVKWLLGAEGAEVPMRLALRGPGGAVTGRVLDPDGAPVVDALVRVGSESHGFTREGDEEGELSPPIEARTDENGAFRVEGVGEGPAEVVARAAGFALWRGEAQVVAGLEADVLVELFAGATVAGVARTPDGDPAARVEISTGHWGKLGHRTRTAADGSYALRDLEPGEITIEADADERGKARTTLFARSGEELRWDVELSTGLELRGRLIDDAGAPLAGWFVQIQSVHTGTQPGEPITDWHHDWSKSDEAGRFVFKNLGDRDHELEVNAPGGGVFALLRRRPVRPGPGELLLEIDRAGIPSVYIAGRVVGPDGRPAAAQLNPWHGEGGSPIEHPDPETGAFELGPYPPGDWTLTASLPEGPTHRFGPRTLAAGERWDLGTLELGRLGAVRLRLARAAGAPATPPQLALRYAGQLGSFQLETEGDEARADDLPPGDWAVAVSGPGFATALHPFEVRADETTTLVVELRAGATVPLRVIPAPGTEPAYLRVTLRDAEERVVAERWVPKPEGAWDLQFHLGPGEYRVDADARVKGGGAGSAGGGSSVLRVESAGAAVEANELPLVLER